MGNRGRFDAPPGTGPTVKTSEIKGGDHTVADYFTGPFPGVVVEPFPPVLVELFEKITSTRFDPRAMVAYERVRAYLGFDAIPITPQLQAAQHLEDNYPERAGMEPIRPDAQRPNDATIRERVRELTTPAPTSPIDPRDLGSD